MLQISFLGMMSPNDHNEQELGRSEPGGYTSFHSETLQPQADWKCISCVIDTNTYYDIWSCYKRGGTALNLWPCCFFEYHVKLQGESVELVFFLQLNATANWEFHQQKMVIKNGKTYCMYLYLCFMCKFGRVNHYIIYIEHQTSLKTLVEFPAGHCNMSIGNPS